MTNAEQNRGQIFFDLSDPTLSYLQKDNLEILKPSIDNLKSICENYNSRFLLTDFGVERMTLVCNNDGSEVYRVLGFAHAMDGCRGEFQETIKLDDNRCPDYTEQFKIFP